MLLLVSETDIREAGVRIDAQRERRLQQARKLLIKFIDPQMDETPSSLHPGSRYPGRPKNFEVIAQRAGSDRSVELAPGTLFSIAEEPDQPQPDRVGQRMQNVGKLHGLDVRVRRLSHSLMLHAPCSRVVEPRASNIKESP